MTHTGTRTKLLFLIALSLLFAPCYTNATVLINEIAWMGSTDSANDEWIELYNTGGTAVSLDGWTLSSDSDLSIALSGSLEAGAYAVLERTDDQSAPGAAFLIYTGALPNTGATLTLKRNTGATEDTVLGGENWEQIGGDNTTKQTAQRTLSGWITAPATPGSANEDLSDDDEEEQSHDEEDIQEDDSNQKETSEDKKKSTASAAELVLPDVSLTLTLHAPSIAYVHQPVSLSIDPGGISELLQKSVQYQWNLGDLSLKEGKEITHQYEYPGTYMIVVEGSFARHRAMLTHQITILPVSFSITTDANGNVQINNNAKYAIDMSGYSVRGDDTIVFPDNTVLLADATLTIPKEKLGTGSYAWLFDQKAKIVASKMSIPDNPVAVAFEPSLASVSYDQVSPSNTVQKSTADTPFVFGTSTDIQVSTSVESTIVPQGSTSARINDEAFLPFNRNLFPYIGFFGVLSLGVFALYTTRRL